MIFAERCICTILTTKTVSGIIAHLLPLTNVYKCPKGPNGLKCPNGPNGPKGPKGPKGHVERITTLLPFNNPYAPSSLFAGVLIEVRRKNKVTPLPIAVGSQFFINTPIRSSLVVAR